jgi:hypothetical protein
METHNRETEKPIPTKLRCPLMAHQVTIPVSPETRNRVREIKGFERTYDELLSEWASEFADDGRIKSGT